MRIAVMAHNLRSAGGLSVGRNIVAALRRVADRHEYCVTLPAGVGYEKIELPTRCRTHYLHRRLGSVNQILFEYLRLPGLVRDFRPDLVWGLGNFGLRRPGCPQAMLCHQPYFVYDPADQPRRVWYRRPEVRMTFVRFRRGLPYIQLVFCQTQTMLERFRRAFDFRGELALLPNAVSRYAVEGIPAKPPPLAGLDGRYPLFCLTKYYIHKNLHSLIDLFEKHGNSLRDAVVVLTVSAADDEAAPAFLRRLRRSPAREHFLVVGTLPQSELAGYFRHCRALLLPTVLESFSGTYVEAMQFGVPILTSDMDFAREVCGDAALYFDPWNVDSMRDAIQRLQNEPGLADTLVERGTQRLTGLFRSWDDIVCDAMVRLESLVSAGSST